MAALFSERLFSFPRSPHRAVRHPPRAHAAAVAASRRLHCGARPGVVPHNSLRACALRSNRGGKHEDEARWRAPTPGLRSSSPQKSPLPGAARREVTAGVVCARTPRASTRRRCRAGRDAPERRRGAQRPWPRAPRASTSNLAHLSERSAKRVASYAPGQGREHHRVVGEADRRTEASRPVLRRLRRHGSNAHIADRELRLCVGGRRPRSNLPTGSVLHPRVEGLLCRLARLAQGVDAGGLQQRQQFQEDLGRDHGVA